MVSMSLALRHCGLPCLNLWHALLPHHPGLVVHEDNQAMIKIVETGRNPTMRYIGRTHGVSVGWLHETFKGDDLTLAYEITSRMCADIYTKAFTDAEKWRLACWLINVCDPKELPELARRSMERDEPPPQSGGGPAKTQKLTTKRGIPPKLLHPLAGAGNLVVLNAQRLVKVMPCLLTHSLARVSRAPARTRLTPAVLSPKTNSSDSDVASSLSSSSTAAS